MRLKDNNNTFQKNSSFDIQKVKPVKYKKGSDPIIPINSAADIQAYLKLKYKHAKKKILKKQKLQSNIQNKLP